MGAAASSKQARLCSSLEFNAIFPLKKNIKFVFVPFGLTRQTKTQKILNHDVPMAGAHFLRLYTLSSMKNAGSNAVRRGVRKPNLT